MLFQYLSNLSRGRLILWCYFIWYLVVAVRYFELSPMLWLTSLGLSLIVGIALYINAQIPGIGVENRDPWQTFRFFLTPFCVSSFSALVKGKGFFLVFSPHLDELLCGVLLCATFCLLVFVAKHYAKTAQKKAE